MSLSLPFGRRTLAVVVAGLLTAGTFSLPAAAQSRTSDAVVTPDSPEAQPTDLQLDEDVQLGAMTSHRDGDNFKSPDAARQYALKQQALAQRFAGAKSGKVHEVAKGQFVEMALEKTDKIFVILVEYGNSPSTTAGMSGFVGPQHNQIPQPDRATDNNTIWQADYNRAHFEDMYLNKMADYYKNQSSGRYTVNGQVTEWVKVPFNGPRYGNNTAVGDPGAWTLIADAINIWTRDRLAEGMTLDQIKAYLQQFDQWDRYDYNHNGNFNEPDGYIDHFQIVHAGAGEETGGGVLGADAIWSHRWKAFYNWAGVTGPDFNKNGGLEFGGGWGSNPNGTVSGSTQARVGPTYSTVQNAYPVNHTGIWVADYTIQPENGGLGVFAHEFGHDLGLPDHYDTTNASSNSTGFWNIMSSGSYLGDGTTDIGSRPGDMSGWDKIQLGWSNYEVAKPSGLSSIKLGPAETNTKQAQAIIVPLDPALNVFYLYDPSVGSLAYGTHAFWGGKGDLIDTTMTRAFSVPAGSPVLTMRLNYQIEANWDYAYVSISNDGGTTWSNLAGTYLNGAVQSPLTTTTNPNGQNLGNGITGTSNSAWRLASFPLTAYAGQNVLIRLRYKTDEYTNLKGIMADEITLGSFNDGAENGGDAWTYNGFKVTTGVEQSNAPHYYIAEYRQYRQYDTGLQTGPYTFGFAAYPNMVAHYPYQDGMLLWYWDTGETNNNTSQHPGEGLVLPVDAHPDPLLRNVAFPNTTPFTSPWSATVQAYDSTFGLEPTDALNLPFYGTSGGVRYQFWQTHPSLAPNPLFNDANSYWTAATKAASVIVPKTGTTIRVVSTSAQDNFMQIQVSH